jgi:hypothetical protein
MGQRNDAMYTYENAVASARTHLTAMLRAEFEAVTAYAAALTRVQAVGVDGDGVDADLMHAIERVEVAQRQRMAARAWLTAMQSALARAQGRG